MCCTQNFKLLCVLANRVCKSDAQSISDDSIFHHDNLREVPNVPHDVMEILNTLNDKNKLIFFDRIKKHYICSAKHLLQKSALNMSSKIKHFRCLQYEEIKKNRSVSDIVSVAKNLPITVDYCVLADEWKLLKLEKLLNDKGKRVDQFWSQIFDMENCFGSVKFPTITHVVRAALTLSHGSADVERQFSVSSKILTDDKTAMSCKMLNARLYIKDGLKQYNQRPDLVPITKDLLLSAKIAHQKCTTYLEEKKKQQSDSEKKILDDIAREEKKQIEQEELIKSEKNIAILEQKLTVAKTSIEKQKKVSDQLLKEASTRLKKAIDKGDMVEIQIAQGNCVLNLFLFNYIHHI